MDNVRGSKPLLEEPRFLLGGSDAPRHLDSVVLKSKACPASLCANNKARAAGDTDGEGLVGREIVAERDVPPGHHLDGCFLRCIGAFLKLVAPLSTLECLHNLKWAERGK
jgi:hypothetical protein